MLSIFDLFYVADLEDEIEAGFVTRRAHPAFPQLAILNYTDECQFVGHWNDVTRQARGVIYNTETGEVLARPIPKFFNYGDEAHTGQLDPDMRIVSAHDKIDGSLGIGYVRPDGQPAIATRGSFSSEQALHATARLDAVQRAHILSGAERGFTPLWEIIYPENRIVLNYGDRDELVYLGTVLNGTGIFCAAKTSNSDFLEVDRATLRDVLSAAPRTNAEGYVIWLKSDLAIKLKQEDYIALHRIVSRLSVKEIWRQLRDGTYGDFVVSLPDEFYEWASVAAYDLRGDYSILWCKVDKWHRILVSEHLETRKDQALWIQANVPPEYRGLVFAALDAKDVSASIWRMIEPKMTTVEMLEKEATNA